MHDGMILKVLGPALLASALGACSVDADPNTAAQEASIVGQWRSAPIHADSGNYAHVDDVRTITFRGRATSGTYVATFQASDATTGCVSEEIVRGQWVLLDDSLAFAASDGTMERRGCTDPRMRRPLEALDADALRTASDTVPVRMWEEPSIGWRTLFLGEGNQTRTYTRQ